MAAPGAPRRAGTAGQRGLQQRESESPAQRPPPQAEWKVALDDVLPLDKAWREECWRELQKGSGQGAGRWPVTGRDRKAEAVEGRMCMSAEGRQVPSEPRGDLSWLPDAFVARVMGRRGCFPPDGSELTSLADEPPAGAPTGTCPGALSSLVDSAAREGETRSLLSHTRCDDVAVGLDLASVAPGAEGSSQPAPRCTRALATASLGLRRSWAGHWPTRSVWGVTVPAPWQPGLGR